MNLGDLWKRVDGHFRHLAAIESREAIFAIEHGLSSHEISELTNELRNRISEAGPRPQDWLWWVIYATEIGYNYAGDEYWSGFKEPMPDWSDTRDRNFIEEGFEQFQQKYRGARPSGAWAKNYCIIAWPITHAFLPKDLQEQLARTLYEIRNAFSAEVFEDTNKLGHLIQSRTATASSRFRQFVESPSLIGRVASALLQTQDQVGDTLLEARALIRIRGDVKQVVGARPWLENAQQTANQKQLIRGGYIAPVAITDIHTTDDANKEVQRLGIEPRLVLYPSATGWEVKLELPDMTQLGQRFPELRQILATSRYVVAGSNGRPQPGGSLVQGRPQRFSLKRWPSHDEVLLKFDLSNPSLEFLLRTECLLRPTTQWLFKVATDGCAYEIRSTRVRPGQRYIVISTAPFAVSQLSKPVNIACQGVFGCGIDAPITLTPDWEACLEQIGLGRTTLVEMWPVGLSPVCWDGDTRSEWLNTETPVFALRSEQTLEAVSLTLEGEAHTRALTLESIPAGQTRFVAMASVPNGEYSLTLTARGITMTGDITTSESSVLIGIREPRPWTPANSHNGLLRIECDPAVPTIRQLWEGLRSLEIYGAPNSEVTVVVTMLSRGETVYQRTFCLPAPPIKSEMWTHSFCSHVKNDVAAVQIIAGVSVCELAFSAPDAGQITLRCEREVPPLLWLVSKTEAGYRAQLQDETDSGTPGVTRYGVALPTEPMQCDNQPEHEVPIEGALYIAELGDHSARIVVPPLRPGDAAAPRYAIDIAPCERNPATIGQLICVCGLWGKAGLPWQDTAAAHETLTSSVRSITGAVAGLLGNYWNGPSNWRDVSEVQMLQQWIAEESPDIWQDLQQTFTRLVSANAFERADLLSALPSMRLRMANYEQDRRSDLLDFALRLLSGLLPSESWPVETVANRLPELLLVPSVTRAARYAVLAVERQHGTATAGGSVYAGWEWPR